MRLNLQEMGIGLLQKTNLECNHLSVIDLSRVPGGLPLEVLICEKSFPFQILRTDNIGLACKRRQTLIGRIPEAGRPKREHLPQMLPRILQKINKIPGTLPQITDSVR